MMPYREAANRIEDHMRIHYFKEYPRAQKITEALQIAIDLLRDMATLQEGGELIISRGSPVVKSLPICEFTKGEFDDGI